LSTVEIPKIEAPPPVPKVNMETQTDMNLEEVQFLFDRIKVLENLIEKPKKRDLSYTLKEYSKQDGMKNAVMPFPQAVKLF
jgi:hypothetical protein